MTLLARITLGLAWLAALLFVLAGAMLTWEVVARYFFTAPTIWAAELSQLCLIWGTLIAMPWVLAARRHIAIDAVVRLLPAGARRVTEALAMAVIAVFAGVVVVYGGWIFLDSFERGRTTGSMLDLPTWVAELAVPVGFALVTVQALVEFVRALRGDVPAPGPGASE